MNDFTPMAYSIIALQTDSVRDSKLYRTWFCMLEIVFKVVKLNIDLS